MLWKKIRELEKERGGYGEKFISVFLLFREREERVQWEITPEWDRGTIIIQNCSEERKRQREREKDTEKIIISKRKLDRIEKSKRKRDREEREQEIKR